MRFPVITAVAITLTFASCSKQTIVRDDEPEPATPATQPSSQVPMATPPAGATPPAAQARQVAPEGIFYLTKTVRVETAGGVRTLTPGTGVKLVRPGIYLTPAGETPLAAEQMTNNLAIARAARDLAAGAPPAVAAPLANAGTPAAASPAADPAMVKELERQKAKANMDALKVKMDGMLAKLADLKERDVKETQNRSYKVRKIISNTKQQITQLEGEINGLNVQIEAAQRELIRLM